MKTRLLWLRLAARSIKREKEQRGGTFSRLLGPLLFDGATFALLYFLLTKYRSLAGWDGCQVLFLYAFHLFCFSVSAAACQGLCALLPAKIQTGELDHALLLPVDPLLFVICQNLRSDFLLRAPLAFVMMCAAYGGMHVIFSPISILLLLMMIVSAMLAQASLFIAASSFSFLLAGKNPFAWIIGAIGEFTRFPLPIYGAPTQILLTFVIPLGFASFYPASVIANMVTGTALPAFLPYLTPLVSALLFLFSIGFWRWMSGRYQSA